MEQLPNHKIPQIGRPGERYRDVQIIRQLPKQDLSLEFCKMIGSSVEKKEYDIFRELRDSIAMDIGIVQEAPNLSVSLVHHGITEFKKNMKLNVMCKRLSERMRVLWIMYAFVYKKQYFISYRLLFLK